jgi:hypothetical protein
MSTRCCIEFVEGEHVSATIYRHSDGYPDGPGGVPADLLRFLMELKEGVTDNRMNDACYLSAKFVVWQARQFTSAPYASGHYMDFLSLGISASHESHGDLAFVYRVSCGGTDNGQPEIFWNSIKRGGEKGEWQACSYDIEAGTISIAGHEDVKVELPEESAADKIVAFVRKVLPAK